MRESAYILAIALYVVGGAALFVGLRWQTLRAKFSGPFSESIEAIATDARYWLAVLAVLLIVARLPTIAAYYWAAPPTTPSPLRSAATQVIRLLELVPVLRNKETGEPFFINVFVMIDSDKSLQEVVNHDNVFFIRSTLDGHHIDENFRIMKVAINAAPSDVAADFPAKSRRQTSVSPGLFSDSDLDAVKNSQGALYVMMIWRYKMPDSPKTYYKELCVFYIGTLDNTKLCPGSHNGTYAEG